MRPPEQVRSSDAVPSCVFSLDRLVFASRTAMAKVIEQHLAIGAIYQVQDSSRPRGIRVCYEIWAGETVLRLLIPYAGRSASMPELQL